MKKFLLNIASVAVISTVGVVALGAQSSSPQTTPQQPSATAQPSDTQAQDAKAFSGTIMKENGKLILKDTTANVTYQLDNQGKAKHFEGKSVKITGKLDATTNVLHVDNIEAGS